GRWLRAQDVFRNLIAYRSTFGGPSAAGAGSDVVGCPRWSIPAGIRRAGELSVESGRRPFVAVADTPPSPPRPSGRTIISGRMLSAGSGQFERGRIAGENYERIDSEACS